MSKRDKGRGAGSGSSASTQAPATKGHFVINGAALERAPVAGFADSCYARNAGDFVDLTFFDSHASEDAAVIARFTMGLDVLELSFWPATAQMFAEMDADHAKYRADAYPLASNAPEQMPRAIRADILLVARGGLMAEVECHTVSTYAMHLAQQRGTSRLTSAPLFTIQIPAGLLVNAFRFLYSLRGHAAERLNEISAR